MFAQEIVEGAAVLLQVTQAMVERGQLFGQDADRLGIAVGVRAGAQKIALQVLIDRVFLRDVAVAQLAAAGLELGFGGGDAGVQRGHGRAVRGIGRQHLALLGLQIGQARAGVVERTVFLAAGGVGQLLRHLGHQGLQLFLADLGLGEIGLGGMQVVVEVAPLRQQVLDLLVIVGDVPLALELLERGLRLGEAVAGLLDLGRHEVRVRVAIDRGLAGDVEIDHLLHQLRRQILVRVMHGDGDDVVLGADFHRQIGLELLDGDVHGGALGRRVLGDVRIDLVEAEGLDHGLGQIMAFQDRRVGQHDLAAVRRRQLGRAALRHARRVAVAERHHQLGHRLIFRGGENQIADTEDHHRREDADEASPLLGQHGHRAVGDYLDRHSHTPTGGRCLTAPMSPG